MTLYNIAAAATDQFLGRLLRRMALILAVAAFAIVAVYHFAVAGLLTLEIEYGVLNARLIVGGVFAVLALLCFVTFWALGRRPVPVSPVAAMPREAQVAMLVEAAMLGYSMARKNERTPAPTP